MQELKLPELGENIETVDVASVMVAVGDRVTRDQPVIEVETEKASLEVPVTFDGRIVELLVKAGDKLKVHDVILRAEGATTETAADTATATETEAAEPPPVEPRTPPIEPSVATEPPVLTFPPAAGGAPEPIGVTVPAAPSSRALARQLGVEINQVRGSGRGGRISREDVKAHAKQLIQGGAAGAPAAPALPDFTRWGEVEYEPLSNVRRATARAMSTSWNTIPHVTQFDHADITQLESMRKRFNARPEAAERKLTMTAMVIKMVAAALRQFPKFNASLDPANDRVIRKRSVHIGVAVDTDRGLLVPVIRDVDRQSLLGVAGGLDDLARRARDRKLKPDEMQGATFTVSNLGGLGTTYFSPIINWPEVAILGVGRAEQQAVFSDGQFQPCLVMPLSLSYDHRWIDGADAARFLRWLAEALEQPLLLLLDE